MITSIFNKSRALNFIIVFIILAFTLVLANARVLSGNSNSGNTLLLMGLFLVSYFSVLAVNFVVYKNNLSQRSNYELLLCSLFLLALPQSISNFKIVCANFLVLLALRRILSIKSFKQVIQKLFDAGVLIAMATLFYFWSILFLILPLLISILYLEYKVKNFMAPILGALSIFIIAFTIALVQANSLNDLFDLITYQISFDYSAYNSYHIIIPLTLIFSLGIWASSAYLRRLNAKTKIEKPNFTIVFYMLIVALVVALIAYPKTGAEFLFVIVPITIIMTNYIENIEEKWFKEVLFAVLLIVPLLSLFI